MHNFIFQNPTKLVFGKGMISELGELIPAGKRIMITFGGGSVRRNGVYDEVTKALAGREWVEFWGIEPNPSIETLREAIALGRKHEVDFLLAVGGGSVIDLGGFALRRRCMGAGPQGGMVRYAAAGYGAHAARHGFRDEQRRRHFTP